MVDDVPRFAEGGAALAAVKLVAALGDRLNVVVGTTRTLDRIAPPLTVPAPRALTPIASLLAAGRSHEALHS